MKTINEYIYENENKHPLWCKIAMAMFIGANGIGSNRVKNLTKESVTGMINTLCDVNGRLKKFSDYLADEYPKDYLAYQPADDEFLKKENNEKIVSQIAEFIVKLV